MFIADKMRTATSGTILRENCFSDLNTNSSDPANNVGRGGLIIWIQIKKGSLIFIQRLMGRIRRYNDCKLHSELW